MAFQLSELDDEALLREHAKSLKGLKSLDSEVPEWVREIRVMYHHSLINELLQRPAVIRARQLALS